MAALHREVARLPKHEDYRLSCDSGIVGYISRAEEDNGEYGIIPNDITNMDRTFEVERSK